MSHVVWLSPRSACGLFPFLSSSGKISSKCSRTPFISCVAPLSAVVVLLVLWVVGVVDVTLANHIVECSPTGNELKNDCPLAAVCFSSNDVFLWNVIFVWLLCLFGVLSGNVVDGGLRMGVVVVDGVLGTSDGVTTFLMDCE